MKVGHIALMHILCFEFCGAKILQFVFIIAAFNFYDKF